MSELDKLEAYLKEHGYKYERIDEENEHFPTISRHQIIVYNEDEDRIFDAIHNYGSYGFEEGLLEVMGGQGRERRRRCGRLAHSRRDYKKT